MGTVSQKSKLSVDLETPMINAGADLKGTVQLTLMQPVENIQVGIEFIGGEKLTLLLGGEADWYSNRADYKRVKGVLESKNSLAPGIYTYPFLLKTSKNLPGSMKTNDSYHKATIGYSLLATAQAKNGFSLKNQVDVILKQVLVLNKPVAMDDKVGNLKIMNIFNRGSSELKVELAKNTFHPNDIANLQVSIDNSQSELNLKTIQVELVRNLTLIFGKGKGESTEKKQIIMKYEHPVIVPHGGNLLSFKSFGFSFPIKLKNKHVHGCGTAIGEIIKSKYYFEVSANFGAFASKIMTAIPVLFVPEEPQSKFMSCCLSPLDSPTIFIETEDSQV